MNIYLLTQNRARGYDTFDSCVVVAESAEKAAHIHPRGDIYDVFDQRNDWKRDTWCPHPDMVTVKLLGVAAVELEPNTVVCASFNSG